MLPQNTSLRFKQISVEDGLSQSVINCIIQDKTGFVWIGTDDGLNRYDGYEFSVYKHNILDTNSLPSSTINALFEDHNENIWIGTRKGIAVFDSYYQKFKVITYEISNIKEEVSSIIEDSDSNIWIGFWGKGLIKYNTKNKSLIRYFNNENSTNSISSNTIKCIALGNDGIIWIGTNNGLDKISTSDNKIEHIKLEGNKQISVNALFKGKDDILWIGTKDGLLKYEISNNKTNIISLSLNNNVTNGYNNIRSIITDNKNYLWLASLDGGIIQYSLINNNFNRYLKENNTHSLASNRVTTVFIDRSNELWTGTWGAGISITDLKQKDFNNINEIYNISDFPTNVAYGVTKVNNTLWIASYGDGVFKINANGNITKYIDGKNNLVGKRFTDIVKDNNGNIWVGSIQKGLFKYDSSNDRFIRYKEGNTELSIIDNSVTDLLIDNNSILWVGTRKGINKFNNTTSSIEQYKFPSDSSNKLSATIMSMDKNGNLWLTGNNKLYKFNLLKKSFQEQKIFSENSNILGNSLITDLYTDSSSNIWISTDGNGIFKYSTLNYSLENFSKRNGLPNNVVYRILPSKDDKIWLTTNQGLSCYNTNTKSFRNYYESDGILSNEFNWKSGFADNNGNLYLGGIKGITVFNPDSIKDNYSLPVVRFTDFKVNHKDVKIGDLYYSKVVLVKDINHFNKVNLSYKDYAISFKFSAMYYSNVSKIKYAYMLEGIDNDWIYTDANNRRVAYTKIPQGSYIFKVKASNTDGLWNETPTVLHINIEPPFWKTWWFRIIALVNAIVIVYIISLLRMRQLQLQKESLIKMVEFRTAELLEKNREIELKNNELEEHRNHLENMIDSRTSEIKIAKTQAEKSDSLKTTFLENISHEIRTPMNGIYGFSQLLDNKNLTSVKRVKYVDSIINATNILLSVFNDLIVISKIHSNQLEITKTVFNLNKLLEQILEDAYKYLKDTKKQNIELKLNKGLSIKECNIISDPHLISQIVNKLVLNALKYTEKGFVVFGYKIVADKIQIEVRDTGIGISADKQKDIFNYFQQEDLGHSRKYGGVGLGLSIVQGLVKLLDGTLVLKSKKDAGSTFVFELPFNCSDVSVADDDIPKVKSFNWSDKTFLVVEDEDVNFIFIKEIIQKTHASIIHAKDGNSAIDLCKNSHFDLILMDIKLPDISGIEATIEIRKFNSEVPIIAQTAHAMANDEQKCLTSGCNAYISKPYKKLDLLNIIASNFK